MYRVTAWYAAAVFGLVQVADAVVPALGLPDWTLTALVVAAIAGFPVAILLSWLFDVTPEGLRRAARFDPGAVSGEPVSLTAPLVLLSFSLLLVAATGWWLLRADGAGQAIATTAADRTLAILPLENRDGDGGEAYFADGLHDEILARVGKVADIRVISRASVMEFAGGAASLAEIAERLNVRFLLRGGVSRAAGDVLMDVELFDTATGRRVWADRFRRPAADLPEIEADVALETARVLSARISPRESEAIERAPTRSPHAMDYLLRGHAYMRSAYDEEVTDRRWMLAMEMYDSATVADPEFALAFTHLAWTHLRYFWFGFDATDGRLALAKGALDQAMSLDPSLPETRHVLGNYYYWGFRDYTQALFNYEDALQELPNDAELVASIGFVKRRQGRLEEAARHQVEGFELDPRNAIYARNLAQTFRAMRRFDEALGYLESAIALTTNSSGVQAKAEIQIASTGDLEAARTTLREAEGLVTEGPMAGAWFWLHLFAREYDEALAALERAPADQVMEPFQDSPQYQVFPRAYLRGTVFELQGDPEAARTQYETALRALEAGGASESTDARVLKALGLTLAALGRGEDATRVGSRLVELLPISEDALWGPTHLEYRARIDARLGRVDEAIETLQLLLAMEYYPSITRALLRLDPTWDRLRGNPGFDRLLVEEPPGSG